jgi:hypothetical protein
MDSAEKTDVITTYTFSRATLNEHVNIEVLAEQLADEFPDAQLSVSKKGGSGDVVVEISEAIKEDQVKSIVEAHEVAADQTPEAISEASQQESISLLSRLEQLESRVSALEAKK